MRDFSTVVGIYGKTAVALNTWRNANSTAFASLTIATVWDHASHTAESKSQGPSSCGFNKPVQALQRLAHTMRARFPYVDLSKLDTYAQNAAGFAQHCAEAFGRARLSGGRP